MNYYLIDDRWYAYPRYITNLSLLADCVIDQDRKMIKFRGNFEDAPSLPSEDSISLLESIHVDDYPSNVVYGCAESLIIVRIASNTYVDCLKAKLKQCGPFPDPSLQSLAEQLIKVKEESDKIEDEYYKLLYDFKEKIL